VGGIERLLRRWAERAGVEPPDVVEVARRIALETLPALGIVDLGIGGDGPHVGMGGEGPLAGMGGDGLQTGPQDEATQSRATLRLTPRGRALLAGTQMTVDPSPSKFVETHALRIGPSARIASVLGLASFADVGRVDDQLEVVVAPPSIARALSVGIESDAVRARIEALATVPEAIARMLVQASVVIGRATHVPVSGFLWIDDPDVRELLRTRRPASELFVDPSPPAGLLIASDVDLERLTRRCRALGVEVEIEPGVLRALRSTCPPSSETSPRSSTVRPRSKTPAGTPRAK
jgi:hypothetical protein